MNPKKTKEKERRRARKWAEEAWEAAEEENLDLAEKIIRRAVDLQPENPVLWNDQGLLLGLRGKHREAEDAFGAAISLAPTYADPYGHLAALLAGQGRLADAVRLLEKAVQHAPPTAPYADRLEGYRALLACRGPVAAPPPERVPPAATVSDSGRWRSAVDALDWEAFGQHLTRHGWALLSGLVDGATCAELRGAFDDETAFAKTVVMDRDDFGRGVYRYFRTTLPAVVDDLRRTVYPRAAGVANEWQRLLGEGRRYPELWEGFRQECAAAGQTTPTPILLKYGPGGFNALHRDLRGSVYFPLQMAVVLSARATPSAADTEGFCGGDFLFCDVPEGKKSRRRAIPAGLGDAVLFCTRDRLVSLGGVWGLQPVKHGASPITAGTRLRPGSAVPRVSVTPARQSPTDGRPWASS